MRAQPPPSQAQIAHQEARPDSAEDTPPLIAESHSLAAARARGRTGGRKPKLNDRQAATVRRMYAATGPDGKRLHTVAEIAEAVGVHRTTVYDYLKKED